MLFSNQLKPVHTFLASGAVTDLVLKDELLYIATNKNTIDVFNTKNNQVVTKIKVPIIKNFIGDIIDAKIYSIDIIENRVLIVAQGEKGFRNIYEYKNNQLKPIITTDKKMYISKSKYINEDQIIISSLGNQLFLYDLKTKKILWQIQVSQSRFSNFALNENRTKIIIADESGSLKQVNTKTGEQEKVYSGLNVDNVFQVDIKNNTIITASKDRRCAIYQNFNQYYKKANFFVYSAGLSPSGKIAGFSNNEDNDIMIFNTQNKKQLHTLKGHKATLSNILFKNENELFSASDDNEVYYWKLSIK